MTWVILGETINGDTLYGRIDEDGLMRVTAVADGVLVAGDLNGDKVADFTIKVLDVSTLTADDFLF